MSSWWLQGLTWHVMSDACVQDDKKYVGSSLIDGPLEGVASRWLKIKNQAPL